MSLSYFSNSLISIFEAIVISSLSQSPVTEMSYEFTGYIFSSCLGMAPKGEVKIIS